MKIIQKPTIMPFVKIVDVDLNGSFQSTKQLVDKLEPLFYHYQLNFQNVELVIDTDSGCDLYFQGQMKSQEEIDQELERREYEQYIKLKAKYNTAKETKIGIFP
jgi:hypothetical protein